MHVLNMASKKLQNKMVINSAVVSSCVAAGIISYLNLHTHTHIYIYRMLSRLQLQPLRSLTSPLLQRARLRPRTRWEKLDHLPTDCIYMRTYLCILGIRGIPGILFLAGLDGWESCAGKNIYIYIYIYIYIFLFISIYIYILYIYIQFGMRPFL